MISIKFIVAAILPCALMATPAFAQSSATSAEDYAKEKAATEVKDAAKDMAQDAVMEKADDMAVDAAKEMHKSDNAMMIKGDPLTIETSTAVIKAEDAEMKIDGETAIIKADKVMTKPTMMEPPSVTTTVVIACPEGTTAQDNGTCMITGDYKE